MFRRAFLTAEFFYFWGGNPIFFCRAVFFFRFIGLQDPGRAGGGVGRGGVGVGLLLETCTRTCILTGFCSADLVRLEF